MRLFPISDLHLERRRPETIARPVEAFDVLVCPGDLYEGRPELGLAALRQIRAGPSHRARAGQPRTLCADG